MNTDISPRLKPEDEELHAKRSELSELEKKLVEGEVDLAGLKAELAAFERLYLKIVGVKYAELDELEAQIAELGARNDPKNPEAQEAARKARAHAEETHAATAAITTSSADRFSPSQRLKSLYRRVAKTIHPDLSTNAEDRAKRQFLMAQANDAYQEGDEARLQAILEEYESGPDSVSGQGTAADLIRAIRKIAQVKRRLAEINTEVERLMKSEIAEMKAKTDEASKRGRDLLAEMALAVNRRIEQARTALADLSKRQG